MCGECNWKEEKGKIMTNISEKEEEEILTGIKRYGRISPAFIQRKLKKTYEEAVRIYEKYLGYMPFDNFEKKNDKSFGRKY